MELIKYCIKLLLPARGALTILNVVPVLWYVIHFCCNKNMTGIVFTTWLQFASVRYKYMQLHNIISMWSCCSTFHISVLPGADPGGTQSIWWKLLFTESQYQCWQVSSSKCLFIWYCLKQPCILRLAEDFNCISCGLRLDCEISNKEENDSHWQLLYLAVVW